MQKEERRALLALACICRSERNLHVKSMEQESAFTWDSGEARKRGNFSLQLSRG